MSSPFLLIFFLCLSFVLHASVFAQSPEGAWDTGAHAVPPEPQTVFENPPNSGTARVELDGSDSHSHHFNTTTGENALIVKYIWKIVSTGKVIGSKPIIYPTLMAGTTVVSLTVIDDIGDQHTDETEVTVLAGRDTENGWLMYLYNMPVSKQSEKSEPLPFRSYQLKQVEFVDTSKFPAEYQQLKVGGARVVGRFTPEVTGLYKFVVTFGGGQCVFYFSNKNVGTRAIAKDKAQAQIGFSKKLKKGNLYKLEVLLKRQIQFQKLIVQYSGPSIPLQLVKPPVIVHGPPKIVIIESITPAKGNEDGGYKVVIKATGLRGAGTPIVRFIAGSEKLELGAVTVNAATEEVSGIVPRFPTVGIKQVQIDSEFRGASNRVTFTVTKARSVLPSKPGQGVVQFKSVNPKNPDGSEFQPAAITSIAYGPDGQFYIGAQDSKMTVFRINRKYVITSKCETDQLYPGKSILGLAFNPRDKYTQASATVYMTLSTLAWKGTSDSWNNGRVETWKSVSNSDCMVKVKTLITGLPVSARDHGVNKLQFDNAGNLYISVGGSTNAGVPSAGFKFFDETPLSGAILVAPIWSNSFDGNIKYDQVAKELTSKQTSGDVTVYASGVRNSFGLLYHGNGKLYATDNGLNQKFGDVSTGCNSTKPAPGNLPDKLLLVQEGEYYGHPNRNRKECKWVDKKGQLASMASSSPGITEYTALTFGGKMVGDLIITKYSNQNAGLTTRFTLSKSGASVGGEVIVSNVSGLDVAQGPYGELLMPKVKQEKIDILVPDEPAPASDVPYVLTVHPRRGPSSGNNILRISGMNLKGVTKVEVGKKPCTALKVVDDYLVTCEAPAGSGKVEVIATNAAGVSASFIGQYIYMTR